MRLVGRLIALCMVACALLGAAAHAETVTVTIGVGDTILTVSGQTSPDAFVTISKDGSVIGTTSADSDGEYSQIFPAQEPGIHQLSVFAHTTEGQNTDTVTLNVNITEHATTTAEIFLPPTITIAETNLNFGQQLALSGSSAPSSTITIYIDNSTYATATADAFGLWGTSLSTDLLASGQHSLFVRAVNGLGEQSYPSTPRNFSLAAQPSAPPPGAVTPKIPVITAPKDGIVWQEPAITVEGTADGGVQVELWDGDSLIGSVFSDRRGNWSIPLQLEPRAYELRARACLDQKCSAFSPTIRFSYEPKASVPSDGLPLKIEVPRSSFTVYEHQAVPLRAIVLDGQPPYRLNIDWGDGKTENRTFSQDDLRFSHVYDRPGKYTVRVDVRDSQGRKNSIYFSVDVKPAERPGFSISIVITISLLFVGFLGALSLFLWRWRLRP